jgi:hypothetical protein
MSSVYSAKLHVASMLLLPAVLEQAPKASALGGCFR